jgi:hypothetical protein
MTVEIVDEADRQAIIMALADLSLARPGWESYLRTMTERYFQDVEMFDKFRTLHADLVQPHGDITSPRPACRWCAEGNPRVQSAVSVKHVHTNTPVGRVVCTALDS